MKELLKIKPQKCFNSTRTEKKYLDVAGKYFKGQISKIILLSLNNLLLTFSENLVVHTFKRVLHNYGLSLCCFFKIEVL